MFDKSRHLWSWLMGLLVIVPLYICWKIEHHDQYYTQLVQTFFLAYIATSLARKD